MSTVKIKYDDTGKIARPAYDSASFPDLDGNYIEILGEAWNEEQKYSTARVDLSTMTLVHDEEEETEIKENAVRSERDAKLASTTDKISGPRWEAMADAERTAVSAYRQALLDVPQQSGFPESITWPEVPAILK